MSDFGSFSIHHVTKNVKRLFLGLLFLLSFDILKSILDDAIVDIKMILKFGPKSSFLDTLYKR